MTLTVSVSEFRQHIADYIAKAKDGYTVILEDGKKGQQIAQLVGKKKFSPETFGKALRSAAGVFTAKTHPEWKSKRDVIKWVEQGRKAADRSF